MASFGFGKRGNTPKHNYITRLKIDGNPLFAKLLDTELGSILNADDYSEGYILVS